MSHQGKCCRREGFIQVEVGPWGDALLPLDFGPPPKCVIFSHLPLAWQRELLTFFSFSVWLLRTLASSLPSWAVVELYASFSQHTDPGSLCHQHVPGPRLLWHGRLSECQEGHQHRRTDSRHSCCSSKYLAMWLYFPCGLWWGSLSKPDSEAMRSLPTPVRCPDTAAALRGLCRKGTNSLAQLQWRGRCHLCSEE